MPQSDEGSYAARGRPLLVNVPSIREFAASILIRERASTPEPGDLSPEIGAERVPTSIPVASFSAPVTPTRAGAPKQAPPVAEQLAEQILTRAEVVAGKGYTEFRLRLDPPNLGTVQIHLHVSENRVTARLIVQEETTRQLLEQQLPALCQRIEKAGAAVGSFDVAQSGGSSHHSWNQEQPRHLPYGGAGHSGSPMQSGGGSHTFWGRQQPRDVPGLGPMRPDPVSEEVPWSSASTPAKGMIDVVA